MNEHCKKILNLSGIQFDSIYQLDNLLIEREIMMDYDLKKYSTVKDNIKDIKIIVSSSNLTSLHENAQKKQRWPLLNLVRQILRYYNFDMIPIRKSDGYTLDGVKKFKRYFHIQKQEKDEEKDQEKDQEKEQNE